MNSNRFPILLLCSVLSIGSYAQSANRSLDSLMRQVPSADTKMISLINEIHSSLSGMSRAEQLVEGRRIIYYIDSTAQAGKPITAAGLYIKARIQKDVMLYMQSDALKTTVEAAEIAEKTNDNAILFLCLAQESHINSTIENSGEAIRLGNMAIALVDKIDPQILSLHDWAEGVASIYNGLGSAYEGLDQYDSALVKYDAGEKFAVQYNERLWISIIKSAKANILAKTGKIDEAIATKREAYNYAKQINDWRLVGGSAIVLSDLYILKNDLPTAGRYLDSTLLALGKAPDHEEELRVDYWRKLAKLEEARGDYRAAFKAQEEFSDGYQELKRKQQTALVTNIQASYDFERNQREIEKLTYTNQQQRTFVVASVIVLTLVIVLAIYFIYSYRLQRHANQIIQEQRDEISKKNASLAITLEDLRATQEQLIQSEKLSSIGLLTAGIAHEINNPVNFIQSGVDALNENMKTLLQVLAEYDKVNDENSKSQLAAIDQLKQKLDFHSVSTELGTLIKVIRNGTERTTSIVSRLQRFSSKGGNQTETFPISKPIDDTVSLIASELKNRIKLETNIESGLIIDGRTSELEQVFMNILMNASQAIKDSGTIKINARREKDRTIIIIRDSGPGIPENVLGKIFDPFFTTKPVGKGMGLGLSITHGIIKSHGGEIVARNNPEGGAEFIIDLPLSKTDLK